MSIFDVIYVLLLIILSPLLLFKLLSDQRFRSSFFARFGFSGSGPALETREGSTLIWVHAASIGEIRLALRLIDFWQNTDSRKSFLITTNTLESRKLGQKETETRVELAPLDFSFFVARFINRHKPDHLILIETELWPNMIRLMSKRGRISIVNGRLSDRYFNRYMRIKGLLGTTLKHLSLVLARDEIATQRFSVLGVPAEKVIFQGNLKYQLPEIPDASIIESELKEAPLEKNRFLMVAGSIQPEELTTILSAWKILKSEIKELQLVVIPRHPDKKEAFSNILKKYSVNHCFLSDPVSSKSAPVADLIYIIDKFGVLNIWYYLANAIFVGGSLCDRGGQNMVEAVGYKKPVCIGPYATNFKHEVELLTRSDGLKIINDDKEMVDFIRFCHDQSEDAVAMGNRGYDAINKQAEALEANVQKLKELYR